MIELKRGGRACSYTVVFIFLCGNFPCIYGKVIEGHRQALFIQRRVIFFSCDMTFSYLVRKESWLEGKKWKREKQSSFVSVTTCLAFISGSFRSTKGNHGAHRIFLFND